MAKTIKKKTTRKTPTKKKVAKITVDAQKRLQMIAETAYYKAEQRGFMGGCQDTDWTTSEKEVDQLVELRP